MPQRSNKHSAYPTQEAGGFVWAYMGPADAMPEFQAPSGAPEPATRVALAKVEVQCNWAHIMDGQIDSAHSSTLHSSDMRPAKGDHWVRPSTDKNQRIQVIEIGYGMRYAAIRRPIADAATHDYVRITTFVAPCVALIPRDDASSFFHSIAWAEDGQAGIASDEWRKFCAFEVGTDVDARFRPTKRSAANNCLQDRTAMAAGNFTGIAGIPNQDIAMWETMGPIADRTRERLGASDIAIARFRRIMIDAVRRFQATGDVIGLTEPRLPPAALRSYQGVVTKSVPWRTLGASAAEARILETLDAAN